MTHTHSANEQVGHSGATLTKGRDPSNTHSVQKAFLRALQRRLREVRGAIRRTVGYENDALQLRSNADAEESYDFSTRQARVRAFLRDVRRWLREALVGDVTATAKVQNGDVWLAEYVDQAYQIGVQNAEGRLLQAGVSLTPSDPTDALRRPIAREQLAELYARAFENLQGVSEAAARQLRQALTGGLAAGKNPRDIARSLSEELRQIERSRLTTIARTEIINSHTDAALATYEDHGANVVSHTSRLTAKDASVCAYCRALEGIPFTLSEFGSVTVRWGTDVRPVGIPAHPNGRCSPLPEIGVDADGLAPLEDRLPDSAGGKPITLVSG